MAAPDKLIQYGSYPTLNILADTADVLMDNITRNGNRERELFKGCISLAVERILESNPTLSLEFKGFVAAWSGFAAQMPGTHVLLADIPGWPTGGGANVFAFDGSTGCFIYGEPKASRAREGKLTGLDFKIDHFPFAGSTTGTAVNPT